MTSPPDALRGAREPQVSSYPDYVDSSGPEAVALAASAGFFLDPWQQDVLTHALGERPDGSWAARRVCLVVPRQNGKSAILVARALAGALLFGEREILWTAHEVKTALNSFRFMRDLLSKTEDLQRRVKRAVQVNGSEAIEFTNGCTIRFIARSKGSGRGFSGDCIIMDEAYAVTEEHMDALIPVLSARPNTQVWYTSSPPLDPVSGAVLMRMRKKALEGSKGSAFFDWGCPAGADLDDRRNWYASNPALGVRIHEETIEAEREDMSDEGFARERLGVWPSEDDGDQGPIKLTAWRAVSDPDSEPGTDLAFGVDVSPDRAWSSVAVYGPRADGNGHVEVMDRRRGTDWVVSRVAELVERWDPVAVALDAKGPAGSLLLDLQRLGLVEPEDPERPKRGQLAIPSAQDVAAACGQLADAVTQQTLRHTDQEPLNAAVVGLKVRPLGEAWAWGRRHSETDISPLVAATLARWAYITRIELLGNDKPAPWAFWS